MRDRKLQGIVLAGLLGLGLAMVAQAGKFQVDVAKGKKLFRSNCRVCHNGLSGTTDLHPNGKTAQEWNLALTDDGVVPTDCIPRARQEMKIELTAEDLRHIRAYLALHASNSSRPERCSDEPTAQEKALDGPASGLTRDD